MEDSILNSLFILKNFRSENLWLDGFSMGDQNWQTYSYRELDFNSDPLLAVDLSLDRSFHEAASDGIYEAFKPRKLPHLSFPTGFCGSSSDMVFYVTGSWIPQAMGERTPIIDFVLNKTSSLFVWQFHIGNKKENHLYEVWSRTNKINNTKSTVNMTELTRDPIPSKFNISITCSQFPVFSLKLNFWDPGNDPNGINRDSQKWDVDLTVDDRVDPDTVSHIHIEGGIEVGKEMSKVFYV